MKQLVLYILVIVQASLLVWLNSADFLYYEATLILICFILIYIRLSSKNKKYNKSIRVVSLTLLVIITVINFTFLYNETINYGLFDEFNYFTAKRDIKLNKIRIIEHGLGFGNYIIIDKVSAKFGFHVENCGCSINNHGFESYNKVIVNYLKKRNGENWESNYKQIIDSLENKYEELSVNIKEENRRDSIAYYLTEGVRIK